MRSSLPDPADPLAGPPVAVIIPAAGRGVRLSPGAGPGPPKALRPLCGVPLLVHAVRTVAAAVGVVRIVVAAPANAVDEVERLLAPTELGVDRGVEVTVVAGGAERPASVAAALATIPPEIDIVLVHDAARPLTPPSLVVAVIAAVRDGADGCVPVLPLADTVKRVSGHRVVSTLDRSQLRAVQTPQGFRRTVLEKAYEQLARGGAGGPAEPVTDDAGLVERLGVTVSAIPGSEQAFKITQPLDLMLAEAVLGRRTPTSTAIGPEATRAP